MSDDILIYYEGMKMSSNKKPTIFDIKKKLHGIKLFYWYHLLSHKDKNP
jgi:hypothetical protein